MVECTENLKSFRAREQNMFEWRQEPCQFRDITDKVSLPKVTRNQTKPLRLKRKHTRTNRHASGLNENGNIYPQNITTLSRFTYSLSLVFSGMLTNETILSTVCC